MLEDFFYYSKSERRVILLMLAVFLCLAVVYGYLSLNGQEKEEEILSEEEEAEIDSVIVEMEVKKEAKRKERYTRKSQVVVLEAFDPNTADSVTFRRLGLSAFTARNIIKYREKGGVFRSAEAFSKIYGITEEQFQTLLPYIEISGELVQRDTIRGRTATVSDVTWTEVVKYPEGTVVDLNSCDTMELKMIPGIGSGIAKLIVVYRNKLGGFYSVEQLREIPYVDSTMCKWFKISADAELRKLRVNKDGLERLRNHPYMNFYKAKVILEHRRKRGEIKNLSQLSMYDEFTEKDLERLEPYLSFE